MSFKYLVSMLAVFVCSNAISGELKLGAGVGGASPYEGSDKTILVPDATIQYTTEMNSLGFFSIGTGGAKWQYNIVDNFHIGILGTYMQGRKEEIDFFGSKNKALKGMGDLKGAVATGIELSYGTEKHALYINSLTALGSRDYGGVNVDHATRFELGINSHYELSEDWSIDSNMSTRYVNKDYNQAYFGVTEKQSLKTAYAVYSPGSGFKDAGVLIEINYRLTGELFLNLKSGGYYLLGDAAESPITKQKYGLINIVGLSYTF